MRTVLTTFFIFIIVGVSAWQLHGQKPDENQRDPLEPVMQRKLDHAKSLLEALATEDHETIARSAQALSLLSLESSWNMLVTEEYLKESNAFRRSLESIRDGAKEQNVDRAALGYVDMTIRCVECHKKIRKNQVAVQDRAVGE